MILRTAKKLPKIFYYERINCQSQPIQEVDKENPVIQTETFCSHFGKKYRVGAILQYDSNPILIATYEFPKIYIH